MVGRMARGPEVEERPAGGARVAVDQHRLLAALARTPAIDPMLTAMAKARVIICKARPARRFAVVLLETGAHLANELALQGAGRGEHCVGIGVFGLQKIADLAGQRGWDRSALHASFPRGSRHSRRARSRLGRRLRAAGSRPGRPVARLRHRLSHWPLRASPPARAARRANRTIARTGAARHIGQTAHLAPFGRSPCLRPAASCSTTFRA